eukprot:scaffold75745_cov19-Prasinocladus_malaysianus.AAC.1
MMRACADVKSQRLGFVTLFLPVVQVTVDDKGLAAIFVFGLPGLIQGNHMVNCVTAALKIFQQVIGASGMDFTAGITTGSCFCGLIGDLNTRAEYAVMGVSSEDDLHSCAILMATDMVLAVLISSMLTNIPNDNNFLDALILLESSNSTRQFSLIYMIVRLCPLCIEALINRHPALL